MRKKSLLEQSDFIELIQYERERSERTNSPFSIVRIDLSRVNAPTNGRFSETALDIIASSIRNIDRLMWDQNGSINVLLPETPLEGAQTTVTKIRKKILAELEMKIVDVDFSISTYPENTSSIVENQKTESASTSLRPPPSLFKMDFSSKPWGSDALVIDPPRLLSPTEIVQHPNCQRVLKRLMDIFGSIVGLLLFSPIMMIIAISIKLTSKGPILFRQERMGLQGKLFTFLKFRTMHINNDESVHRKYVEKLIQGNHQDVNMGDRNKPYYKIKNDPRITPLGRMLRKSSLDELPQFFNVLMGQMSLVGPRPPIPYEVDNYQSWHKKRINHVKPGITGLWQVKGRSQMTFEEMVRLDIHYAQNWSVWLDCKILLKTFKVVYSTNGAD